MNFDGRAPFHSWFLAPECWDRASDLKICADLELITFIYRDYLFSLNEVSDISLSINTSHNKSFARASAIFLRYQSEFNLSRSVILQGLDIDETKNARNFEGGILEMLKGLQKIVIEDEMRKIPNTIGILNGLISYDIIRRGLRISCSKLSYCVLDIFTEI